MLKNLTIDTIKSSIFKLIEKPTLKNVGISVGSIIIAGGVIKSCIYIYGKFKSKPSYPKDVVILHQFPVGNFAPRLVWKKWNKK